MRFVFKEMETDRKMKGKEATRQVGGGCPRATLKSYEKQHFIDKNIIYRCFDAFCFACVRAQLQQQKGLEEEMCFQRRADEDLD